MKMKIFKYSVLATAIVFAIFTTFAVPLFIGDILKKMCPPAFVVSVLAALLIPLSWMLVLAILEIIKE